MDEFVLYDDVQYTRRDWRNRNRIKTAAGLTWLTVPVRVKDRYHQLVHETVVSEPDWPGRHWRSIVHAYSRAAFFGHYRAELEELYLGCEETHLSRVNARFLAWICRTLGIATPVRWSMDYDLGTGRNERLIALCRQLGATEYLSGPAARCYLDEAAFAAAGIAVRWMDYSGYPEHRQLHGPFEHGVSVLDLILNEGPDAPSYMKSFPPPPAPPPQGGRGELRVRESPA